MNAMRVRSQTVEHAFGTFKAWMGADAFVNEDVAEEQNGDGLAPVDV